MLRYRDIIDILIPRAERLGLAQPEMNKVDAVELELYMFNALLDLVELNDLDVYTVRNTYMAQTLSGVDTYPLPDDFGRLILPRVLLKRGIQIDDTIDLFDLEYLDPQQLVAKRAPKRERPRQFTVLQRNIILYPPPDDNTGNNYTLRGLYIERISRPELDDDILLDYPTALVEETLFRMASDAGRVTQTLATTRNEAVAKLIGGPLGNPERIGRNFVERKAG